MYFCFKLILLWQVINVLQTKNPIISEHFGNLIDTGEVCKHIYIYIAFNKQCVPKYVPLPNTCGHRFSVRTQIVVNVTYNG